VVIDYFVEWITPPLSAVAPRHAAAAAEYRNTIDKVRLGGWRVCDYSPNRQITTQLITFFPANQNIVASRTGHAIENYTFHQYGLSSFDFLP